MISIGHIISYILGVAEIYLGYCFLDTLTARNFIKKHIVYVVLLSLIFGITYGYDRTLPNSTLVSYSIILFYIMLMYVSIVIKSSTSKLLNFAVLLIYFVIISYLKLLLAFIFSLYTNDVILVYHSLFYKDVI